MFNIRWPFVSRKKHEDRVQALRLSLDSTTVSLRELRSAYEGLQDRGLNILVGPEYGDIRKDDISVNTSATISRCLAIDALAAPDELLRRVCSETGKMVSVELYKHIKTSL